MSYLNIVRQPDAVRVDWEGGGAELRPEGNGVWTGGNVEVEIAVGANSSEITVRAPKSELRQLFLRWRGDVPSHQRFLGDQWERSYGDLEWRGMAPDRLMPWYFVAFDGQRTHGYGVKTGPNAFCWWMADNNGFSLWLDVRCGGKGVALGDRTLKVATVASREGKEGETPFQAACAFARVLCEKPRLASKPIYGSNNWYFCGPRTSAEIELDAAKRISDLSPCAENRPFSVIDYGWTKDPGQFGPYNESNDKFPDMAGLAGRIRDAGAVPGIWARLLMGNRDDKPSLFLPKERTVGGANKDAPFFGLDPSIPEVLDRVRRDVKCFIDWGYRLIKHDFSQVDIMGRWGFEMVGHHHKYWGLITNNGWSFSDRTRTTAEITLDFYRTIREAAGDAVILGCATVGHLGAGIFETQRSADDNCGMCWSETRKMGLNALAMRMPQQGAFHCIDADVVPVTKQTPWSVTRQWLQVVAESSSALFVSTDPAAVGEEQKAAMRQALDLAARPQPLGEPLDWMETTSPRRWKLNGRVVEFDWFSESGVNPFIWQ